MSLRVKLLILFSVLALIPLGIAGGTMIRITRDELKSSANDNLIAVARQITHDIENFYRYTWLSPLKVIRKAAESKYMGAAEKLSVLTGEMKGAIDFAAIQISIEGTSSPILVVQDKFARRLRDASLVPEQVLELRPKQIEHLRKGRDIFVGDLIYLKKSDTWLITLILVLDDGTFNGTATISARINLNRLIARIKGSPFTKVGTVTLIDPRGRNLLARDTSGKKQGQLVETVKGRLNSNIRTMGTGLNVLPSGERMLGAYAFSENLNLGVIVEMKEANAYLAVTKMMWNLLTWMVIGFAVSLTGAIVISVSVTRPLMRLTQAARKLSEGDFSVSSDIQKSPKKDEVGILASTFIEMSEKLRRHYETLEMKVEERTQKLNDALSEVSETNTKLVESIRYAKTLQFSMLPDKDNLKNNIPDSFLLWKPRDIVGGDIVFTEFFDNGFLIAVIDCTGHGVPGAFMTLIASSGLNRIIKDQGCNDPAEILKRLNVIVKNTLHQNTTNNVSSDMGADKGSDDGMDAIICFVCTPSSNFCPSRKSGKREIMTRVPFHEIPAGSGCLVFAGARLPLICVRNNELNVIKGDRQSIGYRKSDPDFNFTNHTVILEKEMAFYMASDGFADQLGGERERRLGTRRFNELLRENHRKPFGEQKKIFEQAFEEYKGCAERQDDVTLLGFALK